MSQLLDAALLRQGVPTAPLEAHLVAVRRLEIEARRAADQLEILTRAVKLLLDANRGAADLTIAHKTGLMALQYVGQA
jgi:hypothetical protein